MRTTPAALTAMLLLFGSHATAFAPPSAPTSRPAENIFEKMPAAEGATDAFGPWFGPHLEMGFSQASFVTADNFYLTVCKKFNANEPAIKGKFSEWFTFCAKQNKMVTEDNLVACLIMNKVQLCLSFSKEMKEPLSRALEEALNKVLDEKKVLTKDNFGKALDDALNEKKVLTEANFGQALVDNKVLTEANFGKALDENEVLTVTNLKSTLQEKLERNQLYKLAIQDQFAIKAVQTFAFVLAFHFQLPRLGPLLLAMPTEFCRFLCSLACPSLAAVLAGQTCAILARAATMQTP